MQSRSAEVCGAVLEPRTAVIVRTSNRTTPASSLHVTFGVGAKG